MIEHPQRRIARRLVTAGIVALAASAAATTVSESARANLSARAATTCKSIGVDGGKYTGLVVGNTGCGKGRDVESSFNICINNRGDDPRECHKKVIGFTCTDRRQFPSHSVTTGRVSCRNGRRSVRFAYRLSHG